jgi:NitT/TauT family transport system permease protein
MSRRAETGLVLVCQLAVLAAFLAAWEWLPKIEWVSENTFMDPFIVSSPSEVGKTIWELLTGSNDRSSIWPFAWKTVSASLLGLLIGMVLGMLAGLALSSSRFLDRVLQPYLVALNAVPRVAIIPVIVIVFGIGYRSSVFISITVVFFVAFFNAYEGGRTVAAHLIDNARVMGATRFQVMRQIQLPFVIAWTIAALPLAATFSLLVVVTGEILTGATGIGRVLSIATVSVDSTTTFAIVVVLSVIGVVIVAVSSLVERRILHWWGK